MASAPNVKWRNLSVAKMSLSTDVEPLRRASRSAAVSMCGSGIFEKPTISMASAKMPIAMRSAGAASATFAFATVPPIR